MQCAPLDIADLGPPRRTTTKLFVKNKSTFLQDYPLDLSDGIISLTDAPIKAWADVTKFIRSYPDRETPAERADRKSVV